MQNKSGALSNSRNGAPRQRGEQNIPWVNAALAVVSVLLSLAIIEVSYRVVVALPVFALTDWRSERIIVSRIGARRAITDPILGWTVKPWYEGDRYRTIDHGIRSNFGEGFVRTGAILAVGDSFTEGWDVNDDESWPAHLERMTGAPVINAGVFGYGTDQIILRAEQLLPIVDPTILIIGFLEFDIFRSAHSDFGAPKPYFTIDNGGLHLHPPRPIDLNTQDGILSTASLKFRDALGYSAVANALLARLAPDFWYSGSKIFYRKVETDPVLVTCILLERLKARSESSGIRMLLFMQYNEFQILATHQPTEDARRVANCAEAAGIEVVDQFAALRAIVDANPDNFHRYYFRHHQGFGHMTDKGNRHAAKLLAGALASTRPAHAAPPTSFLPTPN